MLFLGAVVVGMQWLKDKQSADVDPVTGSYTLVIDKKEQGHRYQIVMKSRNFVASQHKITFKRLWRDHYDNHHEDYYGEYVDGRRAYGLDTLEWTKKDHAPFENSIRTEMNDFKLVVDGRRWRVPKLLWSDCYQPDFYAEFDFDAEKYVTARLVSSRTMRIKMDASDGAGGYTVIWTMRRGGKSTRRITRGENNWKL